MSELSAVQSGGALSKLKFLVAVNCDTVFVGLMIPICACCGIILSCWSSGVKMFVVAFGADERRKVSIGSGIYDRTIDVESQSSRRTGSLENIESIKSKISWRLKLGRAGSIKLVSSVAEDASTDCTWYAYCRLGWREGLEPLAR